MPKAAGPGAPAVGETVFSDPEVKAAVENVITAMMDRVMDKVLDTDPFDRERLRREKPLYAALVPDEMGLPGLVWNPLNSWPVPLPEKGHAFEFSHLGGLPPAGPGHSSTVVGSEGGAGAVQAAATD